MKRLLGFATLFLLCRTSVAAADLPELTAQVKLGRQLFRQSGKGVACATCHAVEGFGNAVGPDLRRLAAAIDPHGLVMTIQMSMTAYVHEVKLSNGKVFPGIQRAKEANLVEIWDLSAMPPRLLKVKHAQIVSMKSNSAWQHPPALTGYSPQELADIIGYLKFIATGVEKEVITDDLR